MNYDVDYFLDKAKSAEKWITGTHDDGEGSKCINGHCGMKDDDFNYLGAKFKITDEAAALQKLFANVKVMDRVRKSLIKDKEDHPNYSFIAQYINDGWAVEYQQDTPKERILAALRDIKAMQQPKQFIPCPPIATNLDKMKTKYVSVDTHILQTVPVGAQ